MAADIIRVVNNVTISDATAWTTLATIPTASMANETSGIIDFIITGSYGNNFTEISVALRRQDIYYKNSSGTLSKIRDFTIKQFVLNTGLTFDLRTNISGTDIEIQVKGTNTGVIYCIDAKFKTR